MSYDRYKKFRSSGFIKKVPFIPIEKKETDFFEIYEPGKTRLTKYNDDIESYEKYYGLN